jgi:hypothetical protein
MSPERICSACGKQAAPDQAICECGAVLPPATGAVSSSAQLRVQAETIHERLLTSRLQHARKALQVARFNQSRDPTDTQRSRQTEEAQRAVAALEVQLAAQSLRVQEARRAALERPVVKEPAPEQPPPTAPSPEPTHAFRANQVHRAEEISAKQPAKTREPAPFISREEIVALRRNPARPARGDK